MRDALAHNPAKQRAAVAAMVKPFFAQPKLEALIDASRDSVLACGILVPRIKPAAP